MMQTPLPAEPDMTRGQTARAVPPGPAAGQPLALAYATPQPKKAATADLGDYLIAVVRRLMFAAGVGLLAGGLVTAFADHSNRDDAATLVGIGAGLIALVVPFRRLAEPISAGRSTDPPRLRGKD
jgi:hypothetical protein